jgi:putative transposase
MKRSRFTEHEILQLLAEASAGISMAEICKAAGITQRTFYRWRRRFGGLDVPTARQMKELESENLRLRGLVSNLFELLRTGDETDGRVRAAPKSSASQLEKRSREQARASRIAAEKCGGALTGRFASLRVNR